MAQLKVAFHPEAENELRAAVGDFEGKREGLGYQLSQDIWRRLGLLAEFPDLGREAEFGIRSLNLRRYPYTIVYSHRPEHIYVLAMAHYRMRPGYWKGRVREAQQWPNN